MDHIEVYLIEQYINQRLLYMAEDKTFNVDVFEARQFKTSEATFEYIDNNLPKADGFLKCCYEVATHFFYS